MRTGAQLPAAQGRLATMQATALAAVFAAELLLFWACTGRHYAWVYPRWFDQLQYLQEAYGSYDQMQSHGFAEGARHAVATVSPQGTLHGLFGLVAFALAGPSRNAALAVNGVAFILLQAATFLAVRRVSRSFAFAWAAIGFLAAVHSPWWGSAGSATDYRLDWMAACAYGVALAAAVLGDGFRSTRWAVLFGIAVGITLLIRHLTGAYFSLIFFILFAWLLCQPDRWRRCGRLALSGMCSVVVAGWAFWRSWHNIYRYYWIGQFVGPERMLRDKHMNLASDVRWMASDLLVHQFGIVALLLALVAGLVFLALSHRGERRTAPCADPRITPDPWAAVAAFLAVPAVILMLHPDKADQTYNILIPPGAWVVVLLWMRLSRGAARGAIVATCAAVASTGAALFAEAQLRNPFPEAMESEYRNVNALSDFLYFRAEEAGLSRPRVAVTWIFDGLNAASLEVLGRERHRTQLRFVGTLPYGLLTLSQADVMARLADSDFVCLVTRAPKEWPLDAEMESMVPVMRDWCERNLRHDGDIETARLSASIFERPGLSRPPAGGGVALAALMSSAAQGPACAPASVPGKPFITTPGTIRWTTQAGFHYQLRSAYTPVTYGAEGLPAGVVLDRASGEMRGDLHAAGKFHSVVTAVNPVGSANMDLTFLVSDEPWDVSISPPVTARVGVPVSIGFSAYDGQGTLDFIDVTDLTAGKLVVRIPANEDERGSWEGACQLVLAEPGQHRIQLRFVRFDAAGKGAYSFLDRECVIAAGR
jgi:hypothetical protein